MPSKRYVRGDRAFGRLLKQLPEQVTKDIRAQLNQTGRTELAQERSRAPRLTGALSGALTYNVPPVRLSLKVGLVGKAVNRRLFYGWIVEWGRKESVVTVQRRGGLKHGPLLARRSRSAAIAAGVGAYQLHIKPMAPRHFVFVPGVRERLYAPFKNIWGNALSKAAAGVSDD